MKVNDEILLEKIIPYCCENFITFPLWEEGDYRPVLSIWYLPKGDSPYDCYESLKKQKEFIKEWFDCDENYDYEIEDNFTYEQRLLPTNMKNSYKIKIFQKGYILDIIPNYSISDLMKIVSHLLMDLNTFY